MGLSEYTMLTRKAEFGADGKGFGKVVEKLVSESVCVCWCHLIVVH